MHPKLARTVPLLLFLVALHSSMYAITRVVGPPACRPTLPHFATIQSAVDASGAGDTVLVCPGNYPEQITIAIPLTLQGIPYQNQAAVVITAPAGGLVGPAQVLVQNTTRVTLSDLIVDGTGASGNGIEFDNVGVGSDPTSFGHINNVVVRNIQAQAIESNTSYLSIPSDIHDAVNIGLYAYGGTSITVRNSTFRSAAVGSAGVELINLVGNSFTGNTVNGSVLVEGGGDSDISNNTIVSDAGFSMQDSANNKIIGNTIIGTGSNQGTARSAGISAFSGDIDIFSGGNTISGNHISGFTVGAALHDLYGNSFVQNVLTDNVTAIFVNDFVGLSTTPTVVTNNTINEATCGVSIGGEGTIFAPNTYSM